MPKRRDKVDCRKETSVALRCRQLQFYIRALWISPKRKHWHPYADTLQRLMYSSQTHQLWPCRHNLSPWKAEKRRKPCGAHLKINKDKRNHHSAHPRKAVFKQMHKAVPKLSLPWRASEVALRQWSFFVVKFASQVFWGKLNFTFVKKLHCNLLQLHFKPQVWNFTKKIPPEKEFFCSSSGGFVLYW